MAKRPSQPWTTAARKRLVAGSLTAVIGVAVALTVAGPAGSASALSTTSCATVDGTTSCVSVVGPRPMSVRWQ